MKSEKKEKKQPENTKSASFFKELGTFMEPYRGGYAGSILISILGVAAGVAAYGFVGAAASLLFAPDPSWEAVLPLAAAAVICKLLRVVLLNVSTWISHKAAYRTLRDVRTAISEKLLRLPMGYFEEKRLRPSENHAGGPH